MSTWATRAISAGRVDGAVLSPFASPVRGNGYKVDAARTAAAIKDAGGTLWFDAMTHALQMPLVGDWRYYDEWDLWASRRNDLTTASAQERHIQRVFVLQEELGAVRLAPTILLTGAGTLLSQLAIDIARVGRALGGPDTWISIAGDPSFWSSGAELDAHIGALDQLEPAGWSISVTRSVSAIPAAVDASEVAGIMRSTFALSRDRPVVVAYGDFAALPAVAAGATALGTGWDSRQRVCAYNDHVERPEGDDGQGQWFSRPTLEGLMGVLPKAAYEVLKADYPTLSSALTPGLIGAGPENAFSHHASTLKRIVSELRALDGKSRTMALRSRYVAAQSEWDSVQRLTGTTQGRMQWVDPLLAGLDQFAAEEGWL